MIKGIVRRILGDNTVESIKEAIVRRRIRLYGTKAIDVLGELAAEYNKTYWLAFGTLLGAYREKGFIKNDDDIDTAMFCSDITSEFIESLCKRGFQLAHCLLTGDHNFCQVSFKYHNISFDIYGFNKKGDDNSEIVGFIPRALHGKDWDESFKLNKFKVLLVTMPFGGVQETKFLDIKANIPKQTELFLRKHYGEDFMTPIKGKKGNSRETIEEIPIDQMTASIVPLDEMLKLIK